MEQVKIFRRSTIYTDQLQQDINIFLEERKGKIFITNIKQSESEHSVTISIFYEDEYRREISLNDTNEFVGNNRIQ